jgi:hypothetical protein
MAKWMKTILISTTEWEYNMVYCIKAYRLTRNKNIPRKTDPGYFLPLKYNKMTESKIPNRERNWSIC